MSEPTRFLRLASQGDSITLGGTQSYVKLKTVTINKGAVNPQTSVAATVTILASNPSTANTQVAILSASNANSPTYVDFSGALCQNGLTAYLAGANADITITYT